MSVDTTVYLGWFFVCVMAKVPRTVQIRGCSKSPRTHSEVSGKTKFCPDCGAPISDQELTESDYASLTNVLYEIEDDEENITPVNISRSDKAFIKRNFNLLLSEGLVKANEELLIYDPGSYAINPDDEGVKLNLDHNVVNNKPGPDVIERLKKIGQYKDVVLRFGSVVHMH